MTRAIKTAGHCRDFAVVATLSLILIAAAGRAGAAGCSLEPQGEGRVAAIIDARTFRLEDGREVRLAGIEPAVTETAKANRTSALAAIIAGREVTLSGEDDTPDRYGRQPPSCSSLLPKPRSKRCCWRRARLWFPQPLPTRTVPRS